MKDIYLRRNVSLNRLRCPFVAYTPTTVFYWSHSLNVFLCGVPTPLNLGPETTNRNYVYELRLTWSNSRSVGGEDVLLFRRNLLENEPIPNRDETPPKPPKKTEGHIVRRST